MPKTLPARVLPSPAHMRPAPVAPLGLLGKAVSVGDLPTKKQLSRVQRELDEIRARYYPIPFVLVEKKS